MKMGKEQSPISDNAFLVDLEEQIKEQDSWQKKYEKMFPSDIPNDVCKHAFIHGLIIENSFKPRVGEYNYLFSTKHEDIYVWTYRKNTDSTLVSVVEPSIKEEAFWKTAGRLIYLAFSFVYAFAPVEEQIDYKWMYHFDFASSNYDEISFYGVNEFDKVFLPAGRYCKATEIANLASLIELFDRDDCAYTAVSLVRSAFDIHNCCLECELSSHPFHDHLAEEPKQWNQADFLQNLEMSIVQSCRAVESILGQPPNRRKAASVLRHKQKWFEITGIDPDKLFEKAEKSYLEFYYELFTDLRDPSAHSYGNIHYDLQRKRAVQAQCFAAIVLKEYIKKNMLNHSDALKKLSFNLEFLSRVSDSMSTPETRR